MSRRLAPLCVALLNYNRKDLVKKCAASLAKQHVLPEKILFIDNGSHDYSEEWVRSAFGEKLGGLLEFLVLSQNVGYSQAFNSGLDVLLRDANAPSWVMTLSNDTELEPDCIEKIAAFIETTNSDPNFSKLGMLSPKVRDFSRRGVIDSTGISFCLDGMSSSRGQNEVDRGQYDHEQILVPSGVAAIYRLDMLRDIGLLDASFQAYCEDIDLGLRGWASGWGCSLVSTAIVYHMRSATYGNASLTKLYLVERNHFWVVVKNFPLVFLLFLPLSTFYRYLLQVKVYFVKRGRVKEFVSTYNAFDLAKVTVRAFVDALLGAPKMLLVRKENLARQRRGNTEILRTYWKLRLRFKDLLL